MPRPTKQQIDDEILEAAAVLFARHGFKETSVQRIADAVGYSKTGLLHRYPTKETLQRAVIERCVQQVHEVATGAAGRPPGPERDRVVVTALAHLATSRPGTVSLLLSSLMPDADSEMSGALEVMGAAVAQAFGDEFRADPVRAVRVTGALGAVAVASVALRDQLTPDAITLLADVGYDALGHRE